MNVTATRDEIDRTKNLLEEIRDWEKFRQITSHQASGRVKVTKKTGTNRDREHAKEVIVDEYRTEYRGGGVTEEQLALRKKIAAVAAHHTQEMIDEIIDIYKSELPIPIED